MVLYLANVGVPMIFPALPLMVLSLLPIVLVEALILWRTLKIEFHRSIKAAASANALSTLVGIPVTWFLLVVLQFLTGGDRAFGLNTPLKKLLAVTWQAPWLVPYDSSLYWMVPTAGLVLLIPFFSASWWLEHLVAKRVLKEIETKRVRRVVLYANLVSYGMFALYLLFVLATARPSIVEPAGV